MGEVIKTINGITVVKTLTPLFFMLRITSFKTAYPWGPCKLSRICKKVHMHLHNKCVVLTCILLIRGPRGQKIKLISAVSNSKISWISIVEPFYNCSLPLFYCKTFKKRETSNSKMHGLRTKKSENLGRCGRQNVLWPYLKIWEWEWIFGRSVVCAKMYQLEMNFLLKTSK